MVAIIREAEAVIASGDDGGWKDWLTDSEAEDAALGLALANKALEETSRAKAIDAALSDVDLGNAMNVAAVSATDFAVALEHANEVLSGRADMRAYEDAIDRATAALKENGKTLDINTQAGRTNQAALDAIAATGIKVAEGMQGLDRVQTLRQARRDFVETAIAMGTPRAEARGLWEDLMKVDRAKVDPTISVETERATESIRKFRELFYGIHDRTVTLTTNRVTKNGGIELVPGSGAVLGGNGGKDGDPTTPQALGGFYPEGVQVFARGGIRERANQHLPEMANGRTIRVWNEPETKGETYIPHANDHRRPAAKKYLEKTAELFGGGVVWHAVGGFKAGHPVSPDREAVRRLVGESPTGLTGAGSVKVEAQVDYERLAASLSHIRPIYGQATFAPHNYSEFLREEAQARRLAGSDGVRT